MKKENVYMGTLIKPWMDHKNIKYITFSVTDDCNLACKYCYFTHKTNKHKLSLDVAKKAVDYILSEDSFNIHDGVVWDFIGGEPTLEMDLIDKICDYILYKMYILNHKWLYCYRIMIGTNGLLYDSPNFQNFLQKHGKNLHVNITVDGSKEKHDLSRIKKNGSGSYDDVVKNLPLWFYQTGNYTTKSTFSHEDLPYLKDSIINLWNLGFKNVMANVVFENVWHEGDDKIYEEQLRQLADYIIDNQIWNQVSVRFFSPTIGYPVTEAEKKVNYCGSGNMLSIDYMGNFYPCVRFMDSALNNHKGRIIGDIYAGLNTDKIRAFNALSNESQSNIECMNCEVSKGCSWCTGFNYDDTEDGTIFERKTYHCSMHRANVRANNYFWDKYEEVTKNVSPLRYNKYTNKSPADKYLFILNDNTFEYCNIKSEQSFYHAINRELYLKAIEFCKKYDYIPVHVGFTEKKEFGYYIGNIDASYERDEMTIDVIHHADIERIKSDVSEIVIYRAMFNELLFVQEDICKLFGHGVFKVNLVIVNYEKLNNDQLLFYNKILDSLTDFVYEHWKIGDYVQIDVITDNLFLGSKRFCLSGINEFTLAPDGGIYPCQAFYFAGVNRMFTLDDLLYALPKNETILTMCKKCEVNKCKKCFYLNKVCTDEKVVPFEMHCVKANLEQRASFKLLEKIKSSDTKLPFDINTRIQCSEDLDPLISLRGDTFVTKKLSKLFD